MHTEPEFTKLQDETEAALLDRHVMSNLRTVQVTQEEFFTALGLINVHPRTERYACYWETPNHVIKGKSTPGYMAIGPKTYWLTT
jgi:hypothetical protein